VRLSLVFDYLLNLRHQLQANFYSFIREFFGQ